MSRVVCHLDELLAARGMTLVELSEKVGVTTVNLSVLKNDRAKAIRYSTLCAICEALGCSVGELLEVVSDCPAQYASPAPLPPPVLAVGDTRRGRGLFLPAVGIRRRRGQQSRPRTRRMSPAGSFRTRPRATSPIACNVPHRTPRPRRCAPPRPDAVGNG